ncbi:secretory pathway protein Sec39 [Colletotrichum scovillei]|uniref:Secretory pathway protein Sec39 n=1 Tax=Colletotrichum scovillei TaxID=1209932 RepID=A0A9P7UH90_9PEZI|nr:secretory pathway protein Sec39 [Colletotrichum scovillei]KAF4785808.1 secretory pathway protein Sec39 [Colletotrichum scovillei]KAG7055691.1 secretory pathway protein Sec39 [Colletotrichum scovillei]KAG7075110.1 secretory pathway protein Sec39 [Colletotrichum scovillei]KAG7082404.1 secretory pathway protein Sec39 [Colletotrichum scovillei]
MSLVLSPPKLVLLAVHLAIHADIESLAFLASRHATVLRKDLVLRILLTYLPETVSSSDYLSFLEELSTGEFIDREAENIDYSIVENLSDEDAAKKVRRLHLLPLARKDITVETDDDPLTLFLLHRAHRVDEEAGLLNQLPELLGPFIQYAPGIRVWMVSTVLPLLRRNYEYYPTESVPYTLAEFQSLPDGAAIDALLSQTGAQPEDYTLIGRDLRGMLVPWLHDDARWKRLDETESTEEGVYSAGWERFLEWLLSKSSSSWRVAVAAVEQWGGAVDVDLGEHDVVWLSEQQQQHLDRRYARAIMACAYLVPEASVEALEGAHQMLRKVMDLLGQDDMMSLREGADTLSAVAYLEGDGILNHKNTAFMRDDLLKDSNPLTKPSRKSTRLLHGLILSAFILTQCGLPCTIKRAGDLAFIQDERDQKAEVIQLIHTLAEKAPKNDETYWIKARKEVIWLRDWGIAPTPEGKVMGIFAKVKSEVIETEILRALLSSARYSLARSLYEDATNKPLSPQIVQETIVAAALNAYDNASNPSRARGGLKKCDEIINAFPQTIHKSLPERRRIDSLLKATHALSEYRLVLRQGEPFTPIVLRVHSDPVSIIGKVLEQNPKSYTRIHDLLDVGTNMVRAGLVDRNNKVAAATAQAEENGQQVDAATQRITGMCIEAALKEDDFETAYSYIVNRLSSGVDASAGSTVKVDDDWSWRAALQAGQYIRSARTVRPTHLGNASGNPDIRHLEQRIDCLATALRIAPPSQLQEILKTFRRCEEQLDSAIKEDAAREEDLGAAEHSSMPGGFDATPAAVRSHRSSGERQARPSAAVATKAGDDAPMSLFDLSRATARAATRNFTALSTLQQSAGGGAAAAAAAAPAPGSSGSAPDGEWDGHDDHPRARKRDQLREAAMGTLTSGVGWLIGAPAPAPNQSQAPRND